MMKVLMKFILIVIMVSFIPLSGFSAKWRPAYINFYGDFAVGINYTKWQKFMVSGSVNFGIRHFYTSINIFELAQGWSFLEEYSWNIGAQFSDHRHFIAVLGPGVGHTKFIGRDLQHSYEIEKAWSIPLLAKVYYTPTNWLGINGQIFYSINPIQKYWGATAGVSLGIFHWTSIKYTR